MELLITTQKINIPTFWKTEVPKKKTSYLKDVYKNKGSMNFVLISS
jgi:hypothetical protein